MFLNGTRVIRAFNLHFYRCFVSDSKISFKRTSMVRGCGYNA